MPQEWDAVVVTGIPGRGFIAARRPAVRHRRVRAASTPETVALVVVVSANLAIKLHAAGADGVWLDEALSIHVAQAPVSLATLAAHEPTPPLYYLLLCGWVRLFGGTIESARILSVVLSTATAALLLDLGWRHFDRETGIFAAALFTTSRLQIYYGHEARGYALVGLLCVASFDLFLALAARPTWRKAIALAVVNAALAYAHYVAVLALVAQLAGALVLGRRGCRFVPIYLASQGLAALLFAPQLHALVRDGVTQKDWIGPPTLGRARYVVKRFAGNSTLLLLYGIVAVATAWARHRLWPRVARQADTGKLVVLALWAFAPVALAYAASFAREMLAERYVLYASLGMYLLVAYVIALAPVARVQRVMLAAVLAALALHEALANPMQRHDWRAATAIVRTEEQHGATVVVAPSWHFRPLAYYLDRVAFRDQAHTRARLAARGVVLTEDVRALRLEPRRHVLVLAPEVAPSASGTRTWLEEQGFRVVLEEKLRGLTLLVIEPRAHPTAALRNRD